MEHYIREVRTTFVGKRIKAMEKLTSAYAAEAVARKLIGDEVQEHFIAIGLNNKNVITNYWTVSIGTSNEAIISMKDIFRAAVSMNCCGIIVAHNHPSGEPNPSDEDCRITQRIKDSGAVLDIRLLDHIIIGDAGRYYSFKNAGRM